jgi:hypothetical protein
MSDEERVNFFIDEKGLSWITDQRTRMSPEEAQVIAIVGVSDALNRIADELGSAGSSIQYSLEGLASDDREEAARIIAKALMAVATELHHKDN